MSYWENDLGTAVSGAMTRFCMWAPEVTSAQVIIETPGRPPEAHGMLRGADGFHRIAMTGVGDGDLYRYRLDGRGPFPDPASRFQPQGVHGPSQVVDWSRYVWSDAGWSGIALEDTVLYELHIGTFTPEGTFAAAAERLSDLKELGITAIELMPVGDFPGRWNWGYDGVAPFAPARCYGTPDDLRRLVDRAHGLGLAVHLDVVYNHLGPDGAYQSTFSRFYYSQTHHNPWGAGINFDGPQSEPVRDYVIKNALRWIHEYHFDGLRLDATHAIVDDSVRHILASIASAVQSSLEGTERKVHVIAEDVRNLAGMMQPESQGGWALSGVWSDDFHHQMRRALAGDCDGYFQDFDGSAKSIAATARQGWFYTGQHAPYFGKPRGTDPTGIAASRFIFFLQNHDQAGNRAFGDRIHHKIELAAVARRLGSAADAARNATAVYGARVGRHDTLSIFHRSPSGVRRPGDGRPPQGVQPVCRVRRSGISRKHSRSSRPEKLSARVSFIGKKERESRTPPWRDSTSVCLPYAKRWCLHTKPLRSRH